MSRSAAVRLKLRSRFRPILIGGVMVFIIAEIVALSPASLEQAPPGSTVSPELLIPEYSEDTETTLATGIPKGKIPDYGIDDFSYVSTHGGQKLWRLVAKRAYMFHHEKIVHAREVTAYLYNPDGKTTVVTGKEAKYVMNRRDLEVFGAVQSRFPDGFQTRSEYLRYLPGQKKVEIPAAHAVSGDGQEVAGQTIAFQSHGLDFDMLDSRIVLPRSVRLTVTRPASKTQLRSETTIESDRCVIHRKDQLAQFTMEASRPAETRYVRIAQPGLFARSRKADLKYGTPMAGPTPSTGHSGSRMLQYLTAFEDVLFRETGNPKSLRYGTAGRADFDTHRDVIVLRDFPQVYQDNDTVTGEVIVVHRDTDIVEVEHSNAFSDGEPDASSRQ